MSQAKQLINHLNQDGVIAYPTETLWGLGANMNSAKAVHTIYEIKGRPAQKAVSLLVRNVAMAEDYAIINKATKELLEVLWPGPLTAVLPAKPTVPEYIHGGTGFVGLRCSPHSQVQQLLWHHDQPITTTSINRSGETPATTLAEISWLPKQVMILRPSTENEQPPKSKGSTVVKFSDMNFEILREGDQDPKLLNAALSTFGFL